ncbi:hypothetical protein GMOD_00007059 [Pyrenophora seminiperda CCB06]|uniref:Uncharacterized protein n=1 Tax=Pyrenophora seminiperda CCB06 TaxID=1302712 RepID=A0A3M7MC93_9PLEO|nr:hypothetical protein GMOD_00007059 [Pyrenophora seminiperda CCB06]
MLLLSGIGMVCKHRIKPLNQYYMWYGWRRQSVKDEEIALDHRRSSGYDWVAITDVRRDQQERYTSSLRMRRGLGITERRLGLARGQRA